MFLRSHEIAMENQPLPQTAWGAVQGQDSPAQPATQSFKPQSVLEQWRFTFEAIGWTVEDAVKRFYGQTSTVLDPPQELHTPEQIYRHIMILDDAGDIAAKPPVTRKRRTEPKEIDTMLGNLRVAAGKATEEWHAAVAEARIATDAWEKYVQSKRDAMNKAKADLHIYRMDQLK